MSATIRPPQGAETAAPAGAGPDAFDARARRLDAAHARVAELVGEPRAAIDELCAALDEHSASVLSKIVARLRADERGRELLYELAEDPEVYAAFVKAGIVRPSVAMRALQVLEGVRPYVASHGGDIELVAIEDGVAHVRLSGACQGCGAAGHTLRSVVSDALLAHVPELVEVRDAGGQRP